jgi:outer membrane protein assembly factor BamB
LAGATKQKREVYCFDADTGKLQWQREVGGTVQREAKPPKVGEGTGYAAPTMACDGQRVFAIFANGDISAFDLAGNPAWVRSLGVPKNSYGHASSLSVYQDLVIVQYDQGSSKDNKSQLLALRVTSGETAWSVPRAVPNSWASPIVIEHEGAPQIITAADPWVIAYQPSNGEEIWRAKCLQYDVGPSPVYERGVVYVVSEFPCLSAVRADGRGDVTETHVLWTADAGLPDTASPLVTDQFVLLAASFGTVTCYDVAKGDEPLWEEDFDGSFSSSPSRVGSRVYLFATEGKAWIVEPSREECRRVSEADLGEECVTSPAFQPGRIYIRGKKHLFCIGSE